MNAANLGVMLQFPAKKTMPRYLTLALLVAAQPTTGAGYRWSFARVTTGAAPADSNIASVNGVTTRYWQAGSQLFVLYNGKLYVYQAVYAPITAAARVRTIAGHPYEWNASLGMWSLQSLGATNPNFAPPTGLDATTAGADLLTALNNLLQDFTNNGIPSVHSTVSTPSVAAFQTAWNADPAVVAAGANAQLSIDGVYGNNTHDAVAAVNGGSAYDVNTAAAPTTPTVPTTPTTPTTPSTTNTTTTTTTTTTTSSTGLIIGALVLGAAIVGGTVYYHHGGGKQMLARRRARRALSHHHTAHHAHG